MSAPDYRAPGVRVTQEFEDLTPQPANTALIPNTIAPSFQILDEETVAKGTYDSDTGDATGYVYTSSAQDFAVPIDTGALVDTRVTVADNVDEDKFEVFLRGDAGTFKVQQDHWSYDPANDGTAIVQIDDPDTIDSNLAETIHGDSSLTNSDLDTNPADVMVTTRALRGHIRSNTNENDYWLTVFTVDQIEEELGKIHPRNPLAWGMFWQLSSTDTAVTGQLVSHDIDQSTIDSTGGELLDHEVEGDFNSFLEMTEWQSAFERLESRNVYSIVPQYPVSDKFFDNDVMESNIISTGKNHCELMSRPENKSERIFTTINPNFDQTSSDKNKIAEDLFEFADSFESRRLTLIVPPEVETTVEGEVQTVHANILAHSIAGMDAALSPSAPFTNRPMPIALNRLFGSNDFFRDELLDIIAAGGNYIIEQETEGAAPFSRHQQTTNTTFIEKNERSIIKAVDYSAKLIRLQLEDFIGDVNITEDLLSTMRTAAQGAINTLEDDGIIRSGEILLVGQSEEFPDETVVDIDLTVLYPNNNINVTLFV